MPSKKWSLSRFEHPTSEGKYIEVAVQKETEDRFPLIEAKLASWISRLCEETFNEELPGVR